MKQKRIAILYPGDYEARKAATSENNRFADLFRALNALHVEAVPCVYHPDFWEEVYEQLCQVDAVLVWVNPLQDGHTRTVLDAMLRKLANQGIFVSTHPDVILKMGTKEVLFQTRNFGWGTDTHLYHTMGELEDKLPKRLASGDARVLKQYRGNGGEGVWKVQMLDATTQRVKVRHAQRGGLEQEMSFTEFFKICEQYFQDDGKMIDQAYQARLAEGMIRCYMVHDKVAGFGIQEINALYPIPAGGKPEDAPQPSTRVYHPPSLAGYQTLKAQLETDWIPALQALLGIETQQLPIIWDADFLLGDKDAEGNDSYVLCEINVSSVAPYPESAVPFMAQAVLAAIEK